MQYLDDLQKELEKKIRDYRREGMNLTFEKIDGKEVEYVDKVKPRHYCLWGDVQVFDVMKSVLTIEGYRGFLEGNVIKYLLRWRKKDGISDLKKCKYYLELLIDEMNKDID